MGDKRVTEIKNKWLQLYSSTYTEFTPYWGAAEQKLTKSKVLVVADANDLKLPKIYEAMGQFLEDEDEYLVNHRHAYRLFCSGIERYTITKLKTTPSSVGRQRPLPDPVAEVLKRQETVRFIPNDGEIMTTILKDPVKFLKGLRTTHKVGTLVHKEFTKKVLGLTVEVVGKERARKIWEETNKYVDL